MHQEKKIIALSTEIKQQSGTHLYKIDMCYTFYVQFIMWKRNKCTKDNK